MRQGTFGVVLGWALTLVLVSAPGRAQETRAAHPEIDERAMAVLPAGDRSALAGPGFQCHGGYRVRCGPGFRAEN